MPNLPNAPTGGRASCALRHLDDPADLDRFLDLRAERERIDAELAALSPVILEALEAEDGERADARGLTLEARVRRTYGYSDHVTEVEAYVRECKAAERASGSATLATVTGYVRVSRNAASVTDRAHALGSEAVAAALAASGTPPAIPS